LDDIHKKRIDLLSGAANAFRRPISVPGSLNKLIEGLAAADQIIPFPTDCGPANFRKQRAWWGVSIR